MPVTKSLKKLEKKSSNKLHPRGRKFKQLNRANVREDRVQAQRKQHKGSQNAKTVRMKFFKSCVISVEKPKYSDEEVHVFIQEYFQQRQTQIDELEAARRNNPRTNKQDMLQMSLDQDRNEYKNGFLVPDLSNEENVKRLRGWNEDWSGMGVIETTRVRESE